MSAKRKYESIDRSKLNKDVLRLLDLMKKKTDNFENEDVVKASKVEGALDRLIAKYPDAVKKSSSKSKPKAKAKAKKPTKSKQPAKSKPKRETVMTVAKRIRKDGEKWQDALKRAKLQMGKETKKSKTAVESEMSKLKKLISEDAVLKGFNKSDLQRDAVRKAKPRGKRKTSTKGETTNQYGTFKNKVGRPYWESRENRSDRYSPSYPKNKPFLEDGGLILGGSTTLRDNGDIMPLGTANADAVFEAGGVTGQTVVNPNEAMADLTSTYGFDDVYAKGGEVDGYNIDNVVSHYLDAMLFSSIDENNEDAEYLDELHDRDDVYQVFTNVSTFRIKEFIKKNKSILEKHNISEESLGHDLWYTPNGHGTGFWDRDYGDDGNKLTKSSEEIMEGTLYPYSEDGKVDVDGYFAKGGTLESKFEGYDSMYNYALAKNFTPRQLAEELRFMTNLQNKGDKELYDFLNNLSNMFPDTPVSEFKKGGMMQGYNDRLNESLGNRDGAEDMMMQSYKDRRDESKGMEKSMGRRAYQSVGTMDKMAKGGEVKVGDIVFPESLSGKWKVIKVGGKKSNKGRTFMGDDFYETQIQSLDSKKIVNYPSNRFAKGGMMQGYNDRLNESLGNRDGAEDMMMQSYKDRRDESKGMEKSMGRRAYQSVGTMDRNNDPDDLYGAFERGGEVKRYGILISDSVFDENGDFSFQDDKAETGFKTEKEAYKRKAEILKQKPKANLSVYEYTTPNSMAKGGELILGGATTLRDNGDIMQLGIANSDAVFKHGGAIHEMRKEKDVDIYEEQMAKGGKLSESEAKKVEMVKKFATGYVGNDFLEKNPSDKDILRMIELKDSSSRIHNSTRDLRKQYGLKYKKGGLVKKYKVGDMWSEDFDYEGMLMYGKKINDKTSMKDIEKYAESLEDVNYHTLAKPLFDYEVALSKDKDKKRYFLANFKRKLSDELQNQGYGRLEMNEIYNFKKGGEIDAFTMSMIKGNGDITELETKDAKIKMAKGGMISVDSKNIKDIHKKYKNVSQLENGQTYAIIDGENFNIFIDDKLKVSNNRVVGIKKPSYITGKMAKGGKIGFDGLAKKVAKSYVGKKVPKKFQNQYGKTYSPAEAKEVGDKVAGAVYRMQQAKKMAKGGEIQGGAFDLSLREKSAMYKYLDKGDFTEEKFMKMFGKNAQQTADIIYFWAESRGLNTPQSRRLHKASMKQMGYAKGGKVRKSPFKVGDMVYSYQNPNHKMRVSFVEDRGVEDGVDYGWGYKVALKTDEDGKYDPKGKYSKSSKWMSQNSVSKTKKTKYAKGGKTQGYNDKLDESLGNTKGKRSSKEQNYKDRRNESEAMEKKKGKRKYSRVKTMDKGSRKLKKPNSFFAVVKRKQKKGEAWKDAIQRVKNEMKK